MALDESFLSSIGDIRQELKSLTSDLDVSAKASKQYANLQLDIERAYSGLGKSINVFDKSVKENIGSLIQSRKNLEKLSFQTKNLEIRQKLATIGTQNFTKTIEDLGNAAKKASNSVVSSVGEMAKTLSSASTTAGNMRDELLKFNRVSLETSRTASVLGQSMDFSSKAWKNVNKRTALSKTQFLELQNSMMKLSETTIPLNSEMTDIASVLQDRFGPSLEVTRDRMERLIQLENKLPGIRGELTKMAQAGQDFTRGSDMSNLTLLMKDFGSSMRDLDVMNQFVKPMSSGENALMKFEESVAKRDQAIQNMNVNTAKTAEEAMIRMEKMMTKITIQIDKMLQKFNELPKLFTYIKQIAAVSFGGVVSGLLGVIRYVQQLTASVARATASIARMNGEAASGAAATGATGMRTRAGMLGKVGAVAMTGYQIYGGAQQARGAGALRADAGIEERYMAEASKASGYGQMAGGLGGAVIGGLVGGPMGAMMGASVGGMVGDWAGGKLGPDKDETRGYAQIAMALDKRELKVDRIIKSEQDVLEVINEQADAVDRARAVRGLIEDGLMQEKELRKLAVKHGKKQIVQVIDNKRKHDALLKEQKESNQTAMAKIRILSKQMNLLEAVKKTYGEIAQSTSNIGQNMIETWARGFSTAPFETAVASSTKLYDKLVESSDVMEDLYETQAIDKQMKVAKGAPGSVLSAKGGVDETTVEVISAMWEKVIKAKRKAAAVEMGSEEERKAAKENVKQLQEAFENRVDGLEVSKEIKEETKKIADLSANEVKNVAKSAALNKKKANEAERIVVLRSRMENIAGRITSEHEAEMSVMDAQLDVQRKQASVAEMTAAGYAVSYAHQKQIYDTLVNQRSVLQDMSETYRKEIPSEIWEKHGKALESAGVKMDDLTNLEKNQYDIVAKINAAKEKQGSDTNALRDASVSVGMALKKQYDMHGRILSIQQQELEMTMNLREGYLDVINEMTTSSDMMSQILPDANRGIMAMQELSTRVQGQEFGGAMKRGFVSFTPFADTQDISRAPRFSDKGFQAPNTVGTVKRYQKQLTEMMNANARSGGPGVFEGQASLEKSAAYQAKGGGIGTASTMNTTKADLHTPYVNMKGETTFRAHIINLHGKATKPSSPGGAPGGKEIPMGMPSQGKASGGFLPGPPSDRDNMLGVIDGKHPIALASGEYVVNARSARKFGPLLEMLNRSGQGLADGGKVTEAFNLIMNSLWRVGAEKTGLVKGGEGYYLDVIKKAGLGAGTTKEMAPISSLRPKLALTKDRKRDKLREIYKQIAMRPDLSKYLNNKTNGNLTYDSLNDAYDNYMIEYGVTENARIADRKLAMKYARSSTGLYLANHKTNAENTVRKRAAETWDRLIKKGLSREDATTGALLEATKGSKFQSWKRSQEDIERFLHGGISEAEKTRRKGSAVAGSTFTTMANEHKRKNKKSRMSLSEEEIARIEKHGLGIKGFADGGQVGLASLAAMMSGTVSIGSLNVNGKAIARNLSGANDMSIAMQRAKQDHYT